MACPVVELFRLDPRTLASARRGITGDLGNAKPATLLVYNPLSAPVYFRFAGGDPTPTVHDLACPGSSVMAWPIDPTIDGVTGLLVYPGAVPVGDTAQAIVRITSAQLPAFVGAIN
jgi:multidrug efflux pump subunit AcrA (membrane-fusion protein)